MKDIYILGCDPLLNSVVEAAILQRKQGHEVIVVNDAKDPFKPEPWLITAPKYLPEIRLSPQLKQGKQRKQNNRKGHKRKKAKNGKR